MYEMDVIVIDELCVESCNCPSLNVCPVQAISRHENKAPEIDLAKCIRCGKCLFFCPNAAIQFD